MTMSKQQMSLMKKERELRINLSKKSMIQKPITMIKTVSQNKKLMRKRLKTRNKKINHNKRTMKVKLVKNRRMSKTVMTKSLLLSKKQLKKSQSNPMTLVTMMMKNQTMSKTTKNLMTMNHRLTKALKLTRAARSNPTQRTMRKSMRVRNKKLKKKRFLKGLNIPRRLTIAK